MVDATNEMRVAKERRDGLLGSRGRDCVPVEPGIFVVVTPETSRYVLAGDEGLVYIAVCSTPSPVH